MFRCSKCCKDYNEKPSKVWKNKKGTFEFCKDCADRIDRDPSWQFTMTDWSHLKL